ncbi:MAG: hypothetical protein GXP24_10315, partial [Planctomycetes bacterium]|nr:hypothetical protein [Planctomycetota bacterium]
MQKSWQSHQNAATTTGGSQSPFVKYFYDSSAPSGIFDDAARMHAIDYPDGARASFPRGSTSSWTHTDNLDDRLGRITKLRFDPAGLPGDVRVVEYAYNGTSRLVKTDYVVPDVRREMYGSTANDYDR